MSYILKSKEGGKISVSSTKKSKRKKQPARKTLKEYNIKVGADGGISLTPIEAKKPATKKAGAPAKKPATKKAGKKKTLIEQMLFDF